jgi:hypothetical protein
MTIDSGYQDLGFFFIAPAEGATYGSIFCHFRNYKDNNKNTPFIGSKRKGNSYFFPIILKIIYLLVNRSA